MVKPLSCRLSTTGPVLLRKFMMAAKNDGLVQKVQVIEANLTYAGIKFSDGREYNVSLRDLAHCTAVDSENSHR